MASTSEMVRLIQHAASRLDDEMDQMIRTNGGTRGQVAAMALGSSTLRMVAAALRTDEEDVVVVATPPERDPHGQFTKAVAMAGGFRG